MNTDEYVFILRINSINRPGNCADQATAWCESAERKGGGHVRQKLGDYDRAVGAGVTVVPLLVETFGGCAPPLMSALQRAADWRQNKLTSSEYDETTWSARTWLSFVSQRLSVATKACNAYEQPTYGAIG